MPSPLPEERAGKVNLPGFRQTHEDAWGLRNAAGRRSMLQGSGLSLPQNYHARKRCEPGLGLENCACSSCSPPALAIGANVLSPPPELLPDIRTWMHALLSNTGVTAGACSGSSLSWDGAHPSPPQIPCRMHASPGLSHLD